MSIDGQKNEANKQHEPPLQVEVKVTYVGHHPFQEHDSGSTLVGAVKVAAMVSFGLEASAASRYQLALNNVPVPDSDALGAFGEHHLEFELQLKNELPKG